MIRHLRFVIRLAAGVLWVIVFSIVGKFFGVPAPPKFQEHSRLLRRLTFNQYACLYGALGWGLAMLLASLVDDYLQDKLFGNGVESVVRITFEAVLWLALGCGFGWTVWGSYRKEV